MIVYGATMEKQACVGDCSTRSPRLLLLIHNSYVHEGTARALVNVNANENRPINDPTYRYRSGEHLRDPV